VVRLPRNKLGRGRFRFRLCEKLTKDAALICRPSVVPGDEFTVSVNGHKIAKRKLKVNWPATGQSAAITFPLSPKVAVYGDNYLELTLLKSSTSKGAVTLSEVELVVRH